MCCACSGFSPNRDTACRTIITGIFRSQRPLRLVVITAPVMRPVLIAAVRVVWFLNRFGGLPSAPLCAPMRRRYGNRVTPRRNSTTAWSIRGLIGYHFRVTDMGSCSEAPTGTSRQVPLHYITCHLADAFIQSDLQLIRLSRRHSPQEQCGVKGLAQGSNSCADLIVATPGIEPPTLRVQVQWLKHYATGCYRTHKDTPRIKI